MKRYSVRPRIGLGIAAGLASAWLLACAEPSAVAPGGPSLGASSTANGDPTVTAVEPNNAPQDTTLDVEVFGSNFDRGSQVQFLLGGVATGKVITNATRFGSPKKLIANITVTADADTGFYDVQVTTTTGRKGIGIEMFAVHGSPFPDDPDVPITVTFDDRVGDNLRSDGRGTYVHEECGVGAVFNLDAVKLTPGGNIRRKDATACGGTDSRALMVSFTERVEGSPPGPQDGNTVAFDWFKSNNVELVTVDSGTVLRSVRMIRTGCQFALAFSPPLDPQSDWVAVTKNPDGSWTVETLPPTLDASGNVVERHDVAACIMDEDTQPGGTPPPRSYYHVPFRITVRLK